MNWLLIRATATSVAANRARICIPTLWRDISHCRGQIGAKLFIGLLTAALSVVSAFTAMAADFPASRPNYSATTPAPYDWSGFYMGVHAGYGWRDSTFNVVDISSAFLAPGLTSLNPKSSGILGGIQGGANHQFGNWVIGIETDISMIDGSVASGPFGPALPDALVIAQSETNWLTTFTARLGYAVDRSLFYIKGGVAAGAFSELYTIDDPTRILTGSVDSTRVGWTAGAGLEYALLPNWSIKIEYNYLDFEAKRQTITTNVNGVTLGFDQDIDHSLHLVKAGINYKFGGNYR